MSFNDVNVVRLLLFATVVISVLRVVKGLLVLCNGFLEVVKVLLHSFYRQRYGRDTDDGSPSED